MAGGKAGGLSEPGFLDTPTFTLAGVLACFLLLSLGFERLIHRLVAYLRKRKRNGLAAAVENLVMELTLVGFIALLLTVLQDSISSICVSYDKGTYELWSLITNVAGCDCCVADTATTGSCFAYERACGPGYCNCDAGDPACVVSPSSLEDLLSEWAGNASCPCGGYYLDLARRSPQAVAADSLLKLECDGTVNLETDKCGAGGAPLISVTSLHQIHIFIFSVAMAHVLSGVVMILLASYRIHRWRTYCADEDDEHAQKVRKILASQSSWLDTPTNRWRMLRQARLLHGSFRMRMRGSKGGGDGGGDGGVSPPVSRLGSLASPGGGGATPSGGSAPQSRRQSLDGRALSGSASPPAGLEVVPEEQRPRGDDSAAAKSSKEGSGSLGDVEAGGAAAAAAAADAAEAGAAGGVSFAGAFANGRSASAASDSSAVAAVREAHAERLAAASARARAASGRRGKAEGGKSAFLQRSTTLKRGDYAGWARELAICALLQLNPWPVSAGDIRLMRASFMLTNRVPHGFDFWRYIGDSMEDDFSRIVGVSLEMWITLVIFILISGPLGWASVLFVALAAAMLVGVNTKLVSIIRHVCRGARVNQLTTDVFWLGRPALLLHPIKFILFLSSFVFGFSIFFLWSFGAHSCPFTSRNNSFWWAWVAPWWVCLVSAGIILLDASLRTLPLYSLAVQMGSDFKHHMLPRGVREKLLNIAAAIKKKHKEEQAAAVAATVAERSARGGLGGAGAWARANLGFSQAAHAVDVPAVDQQQAEEQPPPQEPPPLQPPEAEAAAAPAPNQQ